MRLRNAHVKNFKLLRDVSVDFSVDPALPLTVIRAENASGMTSMLSALIWAFYGSKGLEDPSVRLAPAYWAEGQPCSVSVDIQFDHHMTSRIPGRLQTGEKRFRLVRSAIETPRDRSFERSAERAQLFLLSDRGAEQMESPELILDEFLPREMKDIFFTNGDAAMVFISSRSGRAGKREQVKEAIRALLGIGMLELAQDHLTRVKSRFTKQIADKASNADLAQVARSLQEAEQRAATAADERETRRSRSNR